MVGMAQTHTDAQSANRQNVLHHHADWLGRTVFYEVYPQSFADSNADGIGDLPGLTAKLGYIRDLGCTGVWINPCFDSPFRDAGYDISDYTRVAPRYGTNEDLIRLFDKAHDLDMHVLLDLVPGHTSDRHPWFRASQKWDPADREGLSDRYIWTGSAFENGAGMPFVAGESDRDGAYVTNFFAFQPALNYGYLRQDNPWQQSIDSPAAESTREAIRHIMRFWLSKGCDGFRVDMADSLVKNDDDDKSGTIDTWRRILTPIKQEYPQAAFVSEWGRPWQSLAAGFDMDFYLDWGWVPNGYNLLVRRAKDQLDRTGDESYFNCGSGADPTAFLAEYLGQYERSKDLGSFSFITCNHDSPRLAPRLTPRELRLAYTLLLTMPGVPYVYYGDEIGMRYRNLPNKEGGYARTGSRTPMQWDGSANAGFSQAPADRLYLPVDPAGDAPNVAAQKDDPDSLLSFMHALIALRHDHDGPSQALRPSADLTIVFAHRGHRPFVYLRSTEQERILVALNPGTEEENVQTALRCKAVTPLLHVGQARCTADKDGYDGQDSSVAHDAEGRNGVRIELGPQSMGIFQLD
jgi:glycosidase